MKMLSPATYTRYSAILRTLRKRGDRPGLLEMGLAADLAMELDRDAPDPEVLRVLRERLELDAEVPGGSG